MRILSLKRRRGAGMTEYILLVGLIAILLTTVVERYKEQIRVTIVGTTNDFDKHNIGNGSGGPGPNGPKVGDKRTGPNGQPQHWDGSSWVDG